MRNLLFVLVGLALVAPVLAGGSRIAASVDEPFELAGRLFPASPIALQEVSRYNPAQTLNAVWVGDECLGRFLAETSADYWGRVEDALLFQRAPEGHLVLVGFAMRGRSAQEFRFLE